MQLRGATDQAHRPGTRQEPSPFEASPPMISVDSGTFPMVGRHCAEYGPRGRWRAISGRRNCHSAQWRTLMFIRCSSVPVASDVVLSYTESDVVSPWLEELGLPNFSVLHG